MGTIFVEIAIISIVILSRTSKAMVISEHVGETFGCNRVLHNHRVIQRDEMGRHCSGVVQLWGCQGYCASSVIPDWKFPHKLYNHQVCIHSERERAFQILKNCEPGVALGTERYEYVQAVSCKCSKCNSSETSCEGAHKRGPPSPAAVQETNDISVDRDAAPDEFEDRKWTQFTPPLVEPPVYP